MRPKLLVVLLLATGLPLAAQAGSTPDDLSTGTQTVRQVWDTLTTLYGTGHTLTADEFGRLKSYRQELVDAGELDLAARLDLITLAAARENAAADATTRLARSQEDWKAVLEQDQRAREALVWKVARDIGLGGFTLSTASALGFAGMLTRAEGHATSSDQQMLEYGLLGSLVVMGLSLVPLVTGEVSR